MLPDAAIYDPYEEDVQLEVTEDDVELFTCGNCMELACELHKITGWPIHSFVAENGSETKHFFIVPREGWRLDVEGFSTSEEHDQRWRMQPGSHKEFSYEQILAMWGDEMNVEIGAVERAAEIAPLVASYAAHGTPF